MTQRTQNCPKCTLLSFDGATCWNNDCNYPSIESTNERNRRIAAENAERARKRREAEAIKKSKASRPAKPSGRWEQIGVLLAIGGAVGGGWLGSQTAPDTPLTWAIAALLGAGIAYGLRKVIVYGAILAATGFAAVTFFF